MKTESLDRILTSPKQDVVVSEKSSPLNGNGETGKEERHVGMVDSVWCDGAFSLVVGECDGCVCNQVGLFFYLSCGNDNSSETKTADNFHSYLYIARYMSL